MRREPPPKRDPFLPRGSHVPSAHPASHMPITCRLCGVRVTWQTVVEKCKRRGLDNGQTTAIMRPETEAGDDGLRQISGE